MEKLLNENWDWDPQKWPFYKNGVLTVVQGMLKYIILYAAMYKMTLSAEKVLKQYLCRDLHDTYTSPDHKQVSV